MKRHFTASIVQEGDIFIAQCLELDVASQGSSPDEALQHLGEALELHLEEPTATAHPQIRALEIKISAA
jgi:predicted RNase H-like HicB family nuclease